MDRSQKDNTLTRFCGTLSIGIERLSMWGAGILLLINIGDIILGVVARYVFRSSPIWTEELARYTLIWMVMLAANSALRRGEHMTIKIMLKYLPRWLNLVLSRFRLVIFIGIIGFMSVMGYQYALKVKLFTTMGLGISKSIPMMSLPVGMTLLLIQYLLMQFVPGKDETAVLAEDNKGDEPSWS